MGRIAAPPAPDAQTRPLNEPTRTETGRAANANAELRAPAQGTAKHDNTPSDLVISLDHGAQRFVQEFTNPHTEELVLRYPSEAQLAYSRAVVAYMRALNGAWCDGDS